MGSHHLLDGTPGDQGGRGYEGWKGEDLLVNLETLVYVYVYVYRKQGFQDSQSQIHGVEGLVAPDRMDSEELAPQDPGRMDHTEKAARGPRGVLGMAAPRMEDHKGLETLALGNAEEMVARGFCRVENKGEQVVEEVLELAARARMGCEATAAQGIEDQAQAEAEGSGRIHHCHD